MDLIVNTNYKVVPLHSSQWNVETLLQSPSHLINVLMRTPPPNVWEGLVTCTDTKTNKVIQVELAARLRSQRLQPNHNPGLNPVANFESVSYFHLLDQETNTWTVPCLRVRQKSRTPITRKSSYLSLIFFPLPRLFLEREEERERGRETSMFGCLLCAPQQGPSQQTRHVPWLRFEPMTSWFTGQRSIHWATPAKANSHLEPAIATAPIPMEKCPYVSLRRSKDLLLLTIMSTKDTARKKSLSTGVSAPPLFTLQCSKLQTD